MKKEHNSVKTKVKCTQCSVTLEPMKATILSHVKSKHSEERISCVYDNCNYVSARQSTVNEHIIRQHGSGGKYGCEKCSFRTMRPYHLNQHIERVHSS